MRPALVSILSSGKKNRVISNEFEGVEADPHWVPPALTASEHEYLVAQSIPHHEAYLTPAPRRWINQRVVALLSHYFVPDIPAAAQMAALADWIDILSPFPQWAVEAAVKEWLNRPGRQKPMPGDIAAGCRWRVAEPALNLKLLRKMVEHHERQLPTGRRP